MKENVNYLVERVNDTNVQFQNLKEEISNLPPSREGTVHNIMLHKGVYSNFTTIKVRRQLKTVTGGIIQSCHSNFYVSVAEIYRISTEARQLDYSLFTTHARIRTISNALRNSIDDVKLKILHAERYYQWVQVRTRLLHVNLDLFIYRIEFDKIR